MSAILAFVTAAILIIIGVIRAKQPKKHVEPVLVKRYVHAGHGWLRITEDGDVVIGMDDFSQSLIGTIDRVKMPRLLKRVEQGEIAWYVQHGHRLVPMVSPITGRVVEKNESVIYNPSLINTSPYGDGWLFKVRPHKVSSQLRNVLTGKVAQQWQETVRAQLNRFFSGTPALMYQDGGLLMKNISDRCSDDEWDGIVRQFFLVNEPAQKL
jgi:glycine cleavage system H protein